MILSQYIISNDDVVSQEYVNNLGIIIDKDLKFVQQVNSVCKISYYHLKLIARKRKFLSCEALRTSVSSFVLSRLNYCSSLYCGLPEYLLDKLQKVQNCAARLISLTPQHSHMAPILKSLGWLNIRNFIIFRLLTMVYKCINEYMPNYLTELLSFHTSTHSLRSYNEFVLTVPFFKTKFGERAFSVTGPRYWNKLPLQIKLLPNLNTFKYRLKLHLLDTQVSSSMYSIQL